LELRDSRLYCSSSNKLYLTRFRHGNKVEFNGGRKEPEISDWVLKKVGPSHKAALCDEVKSTGESAKFTLVYFGATEGDNFNTFEALANGALAEKLTFLTSDCPDCASQVGGSFPGLTLFRQFDEKVLHSTSFIIDAASEWISGSMVPTLQEFSEDSIEGIFGERKQAIFLFRKEASDAAYETVFAEAANTLKKEIVFVTSGVSDGIQGRLGEFVGVTEDMLPTIRILDPADGMKKYSFEGSIDGLSQADLSQFIDNFKAGNMAPFLKSEPVIETQEGPVHVLVGKSFHEEVVASEDDLLVKFYAPWCGHCKALAPVWEEVAAELKDVKGIKIAKFDATMNEADGVEVQGYPTLKFYKNGKKSAPMAYEGGRTKDEIIDWLKSNSEAYKAHLAGVHTDL
jgi:protein disulfide-isomerase A1